MIVRLSGETADDVGAHGEWTSKRTRKAGQAPAVTDWTVCRFHGARGGGPKGKRNGMYRHGLYTKVAMAERRLLRELLRQCADTALS
jgi:hypothetical protein